MTIRNNSDDYYEKFFDRELNNFERMYEAGSNVAVAGALQFCAEYGISPPQWLVHASLKVVCDLLRREKSTKRGRSTGAIARYRQDMIDYFRWDECVVLEELQIKVQDAIKIYSDVPIPAGLKNRYAEERQRANWLGTTRSRVYECVSQALARTEAFGSPQSIKRSCRQVIRNQADPKRAFRYFLIGDAAMKLLGITPDLGFSKAGILHWRTRR
jgi:hypothetical protein